MFYFLHGDPNKIFKKSQKMTEVLLNKKPGASLFKLNSDNFTEDLFNELLGGQGLFENKYIVVMSRLLEDAATAGFIITKIENLAESENIFIWTEEIVSKPHFKQVEKYATKIENSEIIKTNNSKMNIFDLAGAFGEKDKKQVWVLYQKAKQEFSAEEIYGTLWWQLKSMLLAAKTANAIEAGMKDFPYKKAKQYASKYSEKELEDIAKNLILVYHRSRVDSEDLYLNLEKFILNY